MGLFSVPKLRYHYLGYKKPFFINADQKARLFSIIAEAMQGVPDDIIERQLGHFEKVHPDYATGIRSARIPVA